MNLYTWKTLLLLSFAISRLPSIRATCDLVCVCNNYQHDELTNPLGQYRCSNQDDCQCSGTRRCSQYGWCNSCEDLKNCPQNTHACNSDQVETENETSCLNCEDLWSNCTSCTLTECLSCQTDSVLSNGTCVNCPENCQMCGSTPEQCLGCQSGFSLLNSSLCVNCQTFDENCNGCTLSGCNSCKSGFYFSQTSNSCMACNSTLGIFDEYCINCDDSQCLDCESGHFLFSDGKCDSSCMNGYFGTLINGNHTNCSECSYQYKNCETCSQTFCFSCQANYKLINTSASTDNPCEYILQESETDDQAKKIGIAIGCSLGGVFLACIIISICYLRWKKAKKIRKNEKKKEKKEKKRALDEMAEKYVYNDIGKFSYPNQSKVLPPVGGKNGNETRVEPIISPIKTFDKSPTIEIGLDAAEQKHWDQAKRDK